MVVNSTEDPALKDLSCVRAHVQKWSSLNIIIIKMNFKRED